MNWITNSYYLLNDWYEFKKHRLYLRIEFCLTTFTLGIDFCSYRLFVIELLFFRITVHWLKNWRHKEAKRAKNGTVSTKG